jgi:hypothetical protein
LGFGSLVGETVLALSRSAALVDETVMISNETVKNLYGLAHETVETTP